MKKMLIIFLFCSCSSTYVINGVEVKKTSKPFKQSEKNIVVTSFLIWCSVSSLFLIP